LCQNYLQDDGIDCCFDWPAKKDTPIIIKADQMSDKVYFILSGQIHIMSEDGQFDYGTLNEGSVFGDISILLDEANQHSYFFDPYQEKPV